MQQSARLMKSKTVNVPEPDRLRDAASEPVIQFINVSKAYRYHGLRDGGEGDEEDDEDIVVGAEEDQAESELKPGESRTALENINLSIFSGERVGIVGANGSGKTTFLNIIAGMSHPTSGRVLGRGRMVPLSHIARPLNERWSGIDNIRTLARFLGFPPELIDKRRAEIAGFAGMSDAISRPVRTYSKNMYARLAFATALELDGDIYIADDMIGVGDQLYQAKCLKRLVELCSSGKTLLLASHRLKIIQQLCTRVICLDKGRVQADGPTKVVIGDYYTNADNNDDEVGVQPDGWGRSLPAPMIEETLPLGADGLTGNLIDIPGKNSPDEGWVGGIVEVEISPKPDCDGLIVNNSIFSLRARIDLPTRDATIDLMLEICRGERPLYHSLLPQPLSINAPRELWFEIPINSSLLPDDVYRIRLSLLIEPAGRLDRFVSRAHISIKTKNCGPTFHPRAHLLSGDAPPPLKALDMEWRLVPSWASDNIESTADVLHILG